MSSFTYSQGPTGVTGPKGNQVSVVDLCDEFHAAVNGDIQTIAEVQPLRAQPAFPSLK